MNQIVQAQIASVPSPISPALYRKLDVFNNKLDPKGLGHEIMAADAPGEEDRDAMERRISSLAHWLMPTDKHWLLDQVTLLTGSPMPRRETGSAADAKVDIKLYGSTLKEFPQFALAKTFHAAHAGKIGKPPFLPTPAELYAHAAAQCAALHAEKRKLNNVLTAKINHIKIDHDHRKSVVAEVRETVRKMRAEEEQREKARLSRTGEVAPKIETPEQALSRLLARAEAEREIPREDRAPIQVSSELRGLIRAAQIDTAISTQDRRAAA